MQFIDFQDQSEVFCILGLDGMDDCDFSKLFRTNKTIFLVDSQPNHRIEQQLIQNPQVSFFCLETPLQEDIFARKIAWQAVMLTLKIFSHSGWETLENKIENCHHAAHLLMSEVADFGVKAFRNARINWQRHDSFRNWTALCDQFKDIPAIICGAGPSLKDTIPFLSHIESRAFILSAGTATSILSENHIAPHLSFMLDKETPCKAIKNQIFCEVPVCLQSRLNPDCVDLLHGEKILAPESGPLPWERWWINLDEPIEFGWTVGNFATQIAISMGCNPIIWAGMDLCYQDRLKYANQTKASDETGLMNLDGHQTQRDWILAARFFEEQARINSHVQFINTSLAGLPLAHPIATMPFEKVEPMLHKQFDLSGQLHQTIQCASIVHEEFEQKNAKWKESHQRCQLLAAQMNQEMDDEIVYECYLKPLWQIWQPIFEREAKGQNLDWHRLLFFQQVLQDVQI